MVGIQFVVEISIDECLVGFVDLSLELNIIFPGDEVIHCFLPFVKNVSN